MIATMKTKSRILHLPVITLVAVFTFSLAGHLMAQAPAGNDTRVVPPPPRMYDETRESGDRGHQAEQDPIDPEKAFDSKTGQNLFWDCIKKTWVDSKTGKALGFQGAHDKDGEVVPPPPRMYDETRESGDRGHQAEQDPIDPEKAFDSKTGQNLFWDCIKKTWVDSKTGKALGFQGAHDKDGEVVPPPPRMYDETRESGDRGHQAEQDPIDPEK